MHFVDTFPLSVTPSAAVVAFVGGVLTCFGPCVAPRFIAVVGLLGARRGGDRLLHLAAFLFGLLAGTLSLVAAGGLLFRVLMWSDAIYWLLAGSLVWFGLCSLLRTPHTCRLTSVPARGTALGGAIFLGGSLSLVLSPCCAPMLIALAALLASSQGSASGIMAVVAFCAGHMVPLCVGALCAERITARLAQAHLESAVNVVSGALMLALGGYYAVLA